MRMSFAIAAGLITSPALGKDASGEVIIAPPPAWATVSESLPVPNDLRAPLFFRRQDTQMHLEKTGQTIFSSALIKLNHPNALQLGNVSLSWNPAAGRPKIHAVKVHRAGTVRDVLATTKFEVLRREDQLEMAMLDGMLTAVLRVPDLRVGDELELAYSIPAQDPTLGAQSTGLLYLAGNPPQGRFLLRLSWEDGQEPVQKYTADLAPMIKRDARTVAIAADMPGSQSAPKNAPPRYNWQRVLEFSDFQDWSAVSSRIAPLFIKASALQPNSAIRQEADQIMAANGDALARAAEALKLVQQQVRYIYVGFNGGNISPASAEETWQRRYGDCKGKTALLLALLNAMGISAEAVLANNAGGDDGLEKRLPNPGLFDHVLVKADIDGKTYWLDGTLPAVFPMSQDPIIPYRWVLPLRASGSVLEANSWKPASRPDQLEMWEIDARAGFAEPATIKQTSIKRGVAAIEDYYRYSSITDEQMQTAFRQNLEGSSAWNSLDSVTWRFDSKTLASVLEIQGKGPVEWEGEAGGSRSLSLPGGGFSPPDRRQRGAEQDQTAPYYSSPEFDCRVTTVRLPAKTAQKDWSFNSSFNQALFGQTFRRSFEKRDGAIRMIRSNQTLRTEIDPLEAVNDNVKLGKFDNSMAWIYFDPNSADLTKALETVPATYEQDWVNNDSPCREPLAKAK